MSFCQGRFTSFTDIRLFLYSLWRDQRIVDEFTVCSGLDVISEGTRIDYKKETRAGKTHISREEDDPVTRTRKAFSFSFISRNVIATILLLPFDFMSWMHYLWLSVYLSLRIKEKRGKWNPLLTAHGFEGEPKDQGNIKSYDSKDIRLY